MSEAVVAIIVMGGLLIYTLISVIIIKTIFSNKIDALNWKIKELNHDIRVLDALQDDLALRVANMKEEMRLK